MTSTTGNDASNIKYGDTIKVLSEVKSIADKLKYTDLTRAFEKIISLLVSDKVEIGLIGLTNSGKSTTANSLMGIPILPSSFQRQTVNCIRIVHDTSSPNGKLCEKKMFEDEFDVVACDVESIRSSIGNSFVSFGELVLYVPVASLSKIGRDFNIDLFDTPGMSLSEDITVSTALKNQTAVVLIIGADDVSKRSLNNHVEGIKKSYPRLFSEKNRMLVLINKYDLCFDSNEESWSPDILKSKIVELTGVLGEQVICFSALAALEARIWNTNPGAVTKSMYAKQYYKLLNMRHADSIKHLESYTCENVRKLTKFLERFSNIHEVETKLISNLGLSNSSIVVNNAIDCSLREISAFKTKITDSLNIESQKSNIASREHLIEHVLKLLKYHCKKKIDSSFLTNIHGLCELKLVTIASALQNLILSTASSKVNRLCREFDSRHVLRQSVFSIRDEMLHFSRENFASVWKDGIGEIKCEIIVELKQLLQEFKQDALTAHLTDYLNFDEVNPSELVNRFPFPTVKQPDISKLHALDDASIDALIRQKTVTRHKIENRTRNSFRQYFFFGPRKTTNYEEDVEYQVTIFEVNIDKLRCTFSEMASFVENQIRTSFLELSEQLVRQICNSLWAEVEQLSQDNMLLVRKELDIKKKNLEATERDTQMLEGVQKRLVDIERQLQVLKESTQPTLAKRKHFKQDTNEEPASKRSKCDESIGKTSV